MAVYVIRAFFEDGTGCGHELSHGFMSDKEFFFVI